MTCSSQHPLRPHLLRLLPAELQVRVVVERRKHRVDHVPQPVLAVAAKIERNSKV